MSDVIGKIKSKCLRLTNKKGFTLIEMIIVIVIVAIFFTITTNLIVSSSISYLKQTSKSMGTGVCETVVDDLFKSIPHGENVEAFQHVEEETDLVAGVPASTLSSVVGQSLVGCYIYTDGTWTSDTNGDREINSLVAYIPDVKNIKTNGIDLGYKKIFITKDESAKKLEYFRGLPYDSKYYREMDMTLEVVQHVVVDPTGVAPTYVYFDVKLSADGKDGLPVGPAIESSVRAYNFKE